MGLLDTFTKAFGRKPKQLPAELAEVTRDVSPEATMARVEAAEPPGYQSKDKAQAADVDKLNPYNYTQLQTHGNLHPGTAEFSSLSMDTLEMLSRVPVIDATLGVRIGQLIKHGIPQRNPFEEGYRIQLREPKQRSSPAAQKRAQEIANWLRTCGDPRIREGMTFQRYLAMCGRDSLIYDQWCAEVVYGWDGKPAGFVPVDARTMRMALPTAQEIKNQRMEGPKAKKVKYVQVLNQEIVAQWDPSHFIFGIRNPRTDIRANGYGYPELERLFSTVYDLVNAQVYNARNFTNGVHASGILLLMSAMNREVFDVVSQDIRGMLSGVQNAHRAIVAQLNPELKESAQWIPTTSNNKDMEYSNWLGFLLKLVCAVYQIDPAELGFNFGNEGQSSALNTQGPGERIQSSKERGLWPFLRNAETWHNEKIIHKIDPDFELVLAGYDQATEMNKQDWMGKVIQSHWTLNEIRALDDLPPLETEAANQPLNGIYSAANQYYDQKKQQEEELARQQAAEAASLGAPPVDDGTMPEGGDLPPDEDFDLTDEDIAAFLSGPDEEEPEGVAKAITYDAEVF